MHAGAHHSESQILNPLPRRFLTTEPGIGGRIKVRPEDFLVDELPLYDLDGSGEHLYLGIEKTNVAHGELMSCIRRHFNVPERAIGFAGMKDKHGITRQTISLHLRDEPANTDIDHARIKVLWTARHRNKIRLGHLAGNRFSIRIRDVEPFKAAAALKTLRALEQQGVPNYFGSQRFGYRRNNHLVGAALLRGDWKTMLSHLLGTHGESFPLYQQLRREQFDAGNYAEAAEQWTAADRNERIACTKLAAGMSEKDACLAIGGTALSFWISALQSAVFNRVLDQRLERGTLAQLHAGDIAFKHATRGSFHVTAEEAAGDALAARLASMEISPTGPLWGKDMMQPGGGSAGGGVVGAGPEGGGAGGGIPGGGASSGGAAEVELDALREAGLTPEAIVGSPRSPEGGRRPLRVPLQNPSIEGGSDEHGPYIRVAFDLPRGSYATIVLREIMKNDQAESDAVQE